MVIVYGLVALCVCRRILPGADELGAVRWSLSPREPVVKPPGGGAVPE